MEAEAPVAAEKLKERYGGSISDVDLRAAYAGFLYRALARERGREDEV